MAKKYKASMSAIHTCWFYDRPPRCLLPKSGQSAALNPFTSREKWPHLPSLPFPSKFIPIFQWEQRRVTKSHRRRRQRHEKWGGRPSLGSEKKGRSIDRRNLLLSQRSAGFSLFLPQKWIHRPVGAQSTLQVNQQGDQVHSVRLTEMTE